MRSNPFSAAIRYAIDAAMEGEAYAKEKGYQLEFQAEDVRAIALSHYIGAQRNGGSR